MSRARNATKAEIDQIRAICVLMFPNCFVLKGYLKRPLKIGIYDDLRAALKPTFPGISRTRLQAFLADYTGGLRYLHQVREGRERIDLYGNVVGVVTAHEAEHAKMRWLRRKITIRKRWETIPMLPGKISKFQKITRKEEA